MEHCCHDMCTRLQEGEIYMSYSPQDRMYFIPYKDQFGGGCQVIYYCPWCGKNLPKQLREKLFDVLEREYGLKIGFLDIKKAPEEFQSDEWWRKRNL